MFMYCSGTPGGLVSSGSGNSQRRFAERVRALAASALEAAGVEVRRGKDGRVRALVDRVVRRLTLVADLEAGL